MDRAKAGVEATLHGCVVQSVIATARKAAQGACVTDSRSQEVNFLKTPLF